MSFDNWYIEQFRDTLGQPLAGSDGIGDTELAAALSGLQIPASMRSYYRVAGNHWLNTNHNELRMLDSLESVDGHAIFMDENQEVVRWAIRDADMLLDNPIVYQGQQVDGGNAWRAERYTFSRFMISMWKWILTGDDPA